MSRFLLRFFRMDNQNRLFLDEGIYQHADTDQDERNAEPLSHIEDHIILKSDLRFLYELYKESHSEEDDKEHSDECSPVHLLCLVLV